MEDSFCALYCKEIYSERGLSTSTSRKWKKLNEKEKYMSDHHILKAFRRPDVIPILYTFDPESAATSVFRFL